MSIDLDQARKEYNDLPTAPRTAVALTAAAELALKVAALVDLIRRPASRVRGPKWAWGLGLFVNGVGPAAYWAFARK